MRLSKLDVQTYRVMPAEPIRALIPLPEEKTGLLTRLVDGLDQASLHWLSGYTAGLASHAAQQPVREVLPLAAVEHLPQQQLTIVFGSQTGNAKRLAESLARDAENAGLAVRLVRADAYPLRELKNERLLYVVISTQGDGDPPDDARGFVEYLSGRRAPKLDELRFAVLGLGDSSYAKFCAVGAAIDERLAELGATRVFARGEADVDIDTVATPWLRKALSTARDTIKVNAPLGYRSRRCGRLMASIRPRRRRMDEGAPVRRGGARQPAHQRARLDQGHSPHRTVVWRCPDLAYCRARAGTPSVCGRATPLPSFLPYSMR